MQGSSGSSYVHMLSQGGLEDCSVAASSSVTVVIKGQHVTRLLVGGCCCEK